MHESEVVKSPMLHQVLGSPHHEFVVRESQDPAPVSGSVRKGVPLHRHRTEDEAWYVLEGVLRFQFGSREFVATPGSGVLLPRGTAHTFWNPGPESARYLIIVGPKTAALLEVLHGPTRPPPDALKGLYDSYDVDLLE
jgi:mannose-6-phosphate isomerase-like protein (cupin superfamily)